jgi:hypothetical protein
MCIVSVGQLNVFFASGIRVRAETGTGTGIRVSDEVPAVPGRQARPEASGTAVTCRGFISSCWDM